MQQSHSQRKEKLPSQLHATKRRPLARTKPCPLFGTLPASKVSVSARSGAPVSATSAEPAPPCAQSSFPFRCACMRRPKCQAGKTATHGKLTEKWGHASTEGMEAPQPISRLPRSVQDKCPNHPNPPVTLRKRTKRTDAKACGE